MITCAFQGHPQRVAICQGKAKSFFRTAKGILWPLCQACSDQHKKQVLDLAQKEGGPIQVDHLKGALFDIPLDDYVTLTAWNLQDPRLIQEVIQKVDAAT